MRNMAPSARKQTTIGLIALDTITRQIVAFHVNDRSHQFTEAL